MMVRPACLTLFLLLTACAVPMAEPPAAPVAPEPQAAAPGEAAPMAREEQTREAAAPADPVASAKPKPRRPAPASPSAAPPPPADLDRQPIEELVIKPGTVTGFWRLTASKLIDLDVGLFSGVHIRYGGEIRDRNICWLQQKGHALDAVCASAYVLKNAEGSVDDEGVTMRWWMGAATIIFSGKFTDADRVTGGFSGGVVGLSVTGDVPATLTRLPTPAPPPADAPERPSAALIRMVWEDVRKGALTEGRYEGAAVKRVNQGLSKEMAAETPQQMIYLGEILIRWRKEQRELLQDVYLVQTGAGRRLCRVSANPQGQVVDFSCGALPD
ncbi:MAG TPA: hypothetical protein VKP60_02845 [Magnetospirillaceae bacterium]|nr:hypothetical protein [Magnetospirillaceae bacterium]